MAELADIRQGLADNLSAISGYQVNPYLLSNPTPPSLEVQPGDIEYDLAFGRGLDRQRVRVRAYVGLQTDVGAQKALDLMMAPDGPESVKAAIESDCTLDGTVSDLRVMTCTGPQVYVVQGNTAYLGAEWEIEVLS